MFTKDYWKAALERAITAAAAALAALGVSAVSGALNDINKAKAIALTVASAFLFSIIKGLAANTLNDGTGPGFGKAEVTKDAAEASGADAPPVVDENEVSTTPTETKTNDVAVGPETAVADTTPVDTDSVLMTKDEETAVDPATVKVEDGALNAYSPEFDPAQAEVDHADEVLAAEAEATVPTVIAPVGSSVVSS